MSKEPRPYLDFYQRYHIAPVAQDISNLQKHFDRRDALYRHLGIIPSTIKGMNIIEFGPGTGHNSIFTNTFAPQKYVLVDANPTSLENLDHLLSDFFPHHRNWEIINTDILALSPSEKYDFVFCEGVISFQRDTRNFLKHVAEFTEPGGCLVVTCIDSISYISELLRRVLGTMMVDPDQDIETRVSDIAAYFEPHLKSLKNMSRSPRDWVLDNILQPFFGEMLTIEDAIETLNEDFEVYSSSPHMFSDWRWYKSIHTDQKKYNELALETYLCNVHNFLDYRLTTPPRPVEANRELISLCNQMVNLIFQVEYNVSTELYDDLLELVNKLSELVQSYAPGTAESLTDYVRVGKNFLKTGELAQFGPFQSFFGRGQQYLSFIRKQK